MHALAVLSLTLITLVLLGRAQELFPVLLPLHLGKITLLLGLVTLVAISPKNLLVFLKETPMGRWLIILLILAFCGIPFSIYRGGALGGFLGFCRTLLAVSILTGLSINGREQWLRRACICTVFLASFLMLLDKGAGRNQIGFSYDANDLALLFVVFLPIIVNEALLGGKILKPLAFVTALLSIAAIALTGSRGGIVALAATGLHALLHIKRRRWLLIPALAVAAVVVGVTADEALWQRFQSLQDNTDYNLQGEGGRMEIWKAGIGLMFSHPLFGVGIGQFSTGMGVVAGEGWLTAHNSFIQIGAELGLGGLAAFCGLLISTFRLTAKGAKSPFLTRHERQRSTAMCISLTGYCVGGFFLSQAYGFILYVYLVLAALLYLQLKKAEQAALRQPGEAAPAPVDGNDKQNHPLRLPQKNVSLPGTLSARATANQNRKKALLRQGDMARKDARKESDKL